VEPLPEAEGSRVIVTWTQPAEPVDLRERGIDDLRRPICAAASQFAEDWTAPKWLPTMKLPPQ